MKIWIVKLKIIKKKVKKRSNQKKKKENNLKEKEELINKKMIILSLIIELNIMIRDHISSSNIIGYLYNKFSGSFELRNP